MGGRRRVRHLGLALSLSLALRLSLWQENREGGKGEKTGSWVRRLKYHIEGVRSSASAHGPRPRQRYVTERDREKLNIDEGQSMSIWVLVAMRCDGRRGGFADREVR